MALTEEQREIVGSLWFTRDTNSKSGFISAVEAVISALPKPEPVGRGWLDPISGKLVCSAPDGSTLLYTEAPPASDYMAERDALARAIARMATKLGIINGDVPLTGPQLVMLCDDAASFDPPASEQKPVGEVVWFDPELSILPEKAGKIIDGFLSFMDSAQLGTLLYAAPQPDYKAQLDALLGKVIQARQALQFANDTPGGGINDTIWMMHGPETLFDFLDAAIASVKGGE